MLQFAPLALVFATLLTASPLADPGRPASSGVRTAQKGLETIALGLQAFEQRDDSDASDVCALDAAAPPHRSLATTATLLGCVTETVGEGATQAAGLAAALHGVFVLGASVPMIVGEAAPEPEAAARPPALPLGR